MIRPTPMACSLKKRRRASTSDVQRSIRSPVERGAVIGKAQPLNVVEQEVSQPPRDTFGCVGSQTA